MKIATPVSSLQSTSHKIISELPGGQLIAAGEIVEAAVGVIETPFRTTFADPPCVVASPTYPSNPVQHIETIQKVERDRFQVNGGNASHNDYARSRFLATMAIALTVCFGSAVTPVFAQAQNRPTPMLKPRPFIVGGTQANISDYPWQVALLYGQNPDPSRVQKCGGSIISPYWVLTAAHCVWDYTTNRVVQISEIAVVAGTSQYANGGQRLSVDKIVVHPQWNSAAITNDIALVRTSAPMQATNMTVVDLADHGVNISGNLQVTGWGATSSGGQGSANLLKVTVPYVDNATCSQSYPGSFISGGMMCAGFQGGGKGTCQGDSGGPLVIYGNGPRRAGQTDTFATQVGIVSWAIGCAAPNYYTVYTRVSEYRDWISDSMAEVASLVRQDFSDCKNRNVNGSDPSSVGGSVTVTMRSDGKTRVRVDITRGTPNTSYHFFLKCAHILGDVATNGSGQGSNSFEIPTTAGGEQLWFDMYPEGAPRGNKYQSASLMLH